MFDLAIVRRPEPTAADQGVYNMMSKPIHDAEPRHAGKVRERVSRLDACRKKSRSPSRPPTRR